jgi:hypothetical protein
MKIITRIALLALVTISFSCTRGPFILDSLNSGKLAIVIPDSASAVESFSALELKKHLDLVFGTDISISSQSACTNFSEKVFIGKHFLSSEEQLKPEEAVYVIKGHCIYIYGDDVINRRCNHPDGGNLKDKALTEALDLVYNRTGTLFSVYSFLENELGIRWIKPGDQGIFFPDRKSLTLPDKTVRWTPSMIQRNIRTGLFDADELTLYGKYAPEAFHPSESEALRKRIDVLTWMRRMRMGRSVNIRFSHAYTSYWEKYKDKCPDIFALNGRGERKPVGRIERVKMCPSDYKLPQIVVGEWLENAKRDPYINSGSISGCENDSDGYGDDEWCHCDSCMSLDARKPGEKLTDYVTDRYVHLWNAILKEARKHNPEVIVTGYAYENMLQPPRREKLDDGILIEFIPRMGGNYDITRKLYKGWREAGMKLMMYRPNDMNWEIGLAFGQEERLFQNFKIALENGAIGTDFDSMLGLWDGLSDMAYYILSKGHAEPDASFESLEKEYLDCFGPASEDIAKYYRHWRNIFNNKIMPEELRLNDGINTYFLEWHKLYKLTSRIDEFYSLNDFDITDNYLKDAAAKSVSGQAGKYIRRMQLANEHSRLTFKAFLAGNGKDINKIRESAKNLVDFRIMYKDSIDINWNILFQYQHYQMDDQIGTKYLGFLPANLDSREF